MDHTASVLFHLSRDVRYVATYVNGDLGLNERPGIANASASESDKYEELIVNPTLLTLLGQRGNLDCGGLQYVLVRYGNFFEFVQAVPGGHVSVGIEANADLKETIAGIREVIGARAAS